MSLSECMQKRKAQYGNEIFNLDYQKIKIVGEAQIPQIKVQEHNFLEYLIDQNAMGDNYIKFFLSSKIGNLTISSYTLDTLSRAFKKKQMKYFWTLQSMRKKQKFDFKEYEDYDVISYTLFPTINEMLSNYTINVFNSTLKMDTDSDLMFNNKFLNQDLSENKFLSSNLIRGSLNDIYNNPK